MKFSIKIILSICSIVFFYYLWVYSFAAFNGNLGNGGNIGCSMYPTFPCSGTRYFVFSFEKPTIGDIIVFTCLKGAGNPSRNGSICSTDTAVHRLVSVDPDGCMHIYGDNPTYDWPADWCLYPNEIDIHGVVHKLPF